MTTCMCILIPPIGVAMKGQSTGQIILSIILTLAGFWLAGIIHALVIPDLTKQPIGPSQSQQQNIVVNVPGSTGTETKKLSPSKQILDLSETEPRLTVKYVVMHTDLTLEEAEKTLNLMVERGLAEEKIDENGKICYQFS